MNSQKSKRVLLFGDTHCGHRMGVVPPEWQELGPVGDVQRELWEAVESTVKAIGKVDAAVSLGDAVDGPGARSGGTELIQPKPDDQHVVSPMELQIQIAEVACKTIMANAPKGHRHFVVGTPYHVAPNGLLMEEALARRMGTHANAELNLDVFGDGAVLINCKHHVGSSQIPHGRGTSLLRSQLWQTVRASRNKRTPPAMVVRAHAHFWIHIETADGHGMILPCLQLRSRFGDLVIDSSPDLGLVVADVERDGTISVTRYAIKVGGASQRVVSL